MRTTRAGLRFVPTVLLLAAVLIASNDSRAVEPAQKVMRLGFVGATSPSNAVPAVAAFWKRLRELGWTEGDNLIVERRWAEGRMERLPALMSEVIERHIDVLVTHSTPAAVAAKRATTTVPIVVAAMGDPVGNGLAASLAHPGSNLTGLSLGYGGGLSSKWLELLKEMLPRLSTVAVLTNPDSVMVRGLVAELKAAASAQHLKLKFVEVRASQQLDHAFEQARHAAQAIVVLPDPITINEREQIVTLAAKNRLPAMFSWPDLAETGQLIAYGPDLRVIFRRAAEYVDKILRGAKPADLPIEQPNKFVLAVNLKAAKALRLTIPESILLRADEVIR